MITSYPTLRTAVAGEASQSWSHRADVLKQFNNFLQLAEEQIYTGGQKSNGIMVDGLRIRSMETRSTATLSTTSRFLALPDGFLEARRAELEYTGGSGGKTVFPLQWVIASELCEITSARRPTQFTVTSQYEFNSTPDLAYVMEVQHYAKLTALSAANPTNAILTSFPSIYLYGCLAQLFKWALNAEQEAVYNDRFLNAIHHANTQDRWGRTGPAPQMTYHGSIA